ncbi:MAG: hypothetical protein GEU99_17265 [Luteitalea sp.]|nr:hypothetical protein [Luteitalea sp.]
MPSTRTLAAALLTLAGSASLTGGTPPQGRPELPFTVGKPVPTLTLPDLVDGRPRSLAEFRGKKLILQIFASW